jgi:nucleoside-diphosphate-sugar epimerase
VAVPYPAARETRWVGRAPGLPWHVGALLAEENFYGATTVVGEAMLRSLHDRYGLEYVGLRYMNVYGPCQDYHGPALAQRFTQEAGRVLSTATEPA